MISGVRLSRCGLKLGGALRRSRSVAAGNRLAPRFQAMPRGEFDQVAGAGRPLTSLAEHLGAVGRAKARHCVYGGCR